jgi:hypothetical protein
VLEVESVNLFYLLVANCLLTIGLKPCLRVGLEDVVFVRVDCSLDNVFAQS